MKQGYSFYNGNTPMSRRQGVSSWSSLRTGLLLRNLALPWYSRTSENQGSWSNHAVYFLWCLYSSDNTTVCPADLVYRVTGGSAEYVVVFPKLAPVWLVGRNTRYLGRIHSIFLFGWKDVDHSEKRAINLHAQICDWLTHLRFRG